MEDQGVDPNLRDGDGATPLHFAASRGHLTAVRWLLSHGARLSLDKYGKSPINDAAENQQVECLNVLVQHGATPDQSSAAEATASNYNEAAYRAKQLAGGSQKKYASGTANSNYYNTKQQGLMNNLPSQHSMHQSSTSSSAAAAVVAAHPHPHHQQSTPKIKIPKSPESTSNSCSSDTEPFYLHPPSIKGSTTHLNGPVIKDGLIYGTASSGSVNGGGTRLSSTSPVDYGQAAAAAAAAAPALPNDGLYVNPMRHGSLTPPSPGGSISGESFYLHDPQEVIYNRVKDLFDSDSSSVNNNYPNSSSSHNRNATSNGNSNSSAADGSGANHKNTNALTGEGSGELNCVGVFD